MQTVARVGSSEGADRQRPRTAVAAVAAPASSDGSPKERVAAAARPFDDPSDEAPVTPLTRAEAAELRRRRPPLSPWRVIALQAVVGAAAAAIAAAVWGAVAGGSLAYGAAAVVLPGVLLARGLSSPLSRTSPGASAVSFMLWEVVKIGTSIAMLVLAPKIVQPLSWPALLAGLVLCMKAAWLALLWQPAPRTKNEGR